MENIIYISNYLIININILIIQTSIHCTKLLHNTITLLFIHNL